MRQLSDEEMAIISQMPENVSGVEKKEAEKETKKPTDNEVVTIMETSIDNELAQMIGQTVDYKKSEQKRTDDMQQEAINDGIYVGGNLFDNMETKEGWIYVNRALFGERAKYYPEDWEFYVRPASVDAIRSWSTIDDENANVVDDVFNEIIKSCFKIKSPFGPVPWGNLRSWDRFFVLLLIRQYSFQQGEHKFEYDDECPECDNNVKFVLDSSTLQFDLPDPEIEHHYDRETCSWIIDPAEYDVEGETFTLYLPTLEKDSIIKQWIINRLQSKNKKKIDNVFIKFLPWMANKLSKNEDIAQRQIKELEVKFKNYDTEMFSFMNDVIKNIIVMPSTKLTSKCPVCGEEVTTDIRFPNGVSALFNIASRHKKFGKK